MYWNVHVVCVWQGQQITVQGQQVAQTAEGQTIVYQPVNADGTVLQQGMFSLSFSVCVCVCARTLACVLIVEATWISFNDC